VVEKRKIILCLPARNVAKTIKLTLDEIPQEYKEHILLVDNASHDDTVRIAKEVGLKVIVHDTDRGYGGSQKTLYSTALADKADIVVMLHPDHQYDAKVIPVLLRPILEGEADAVFGSRMLGGRPMEGGMPWWKYFANIILTAFANIIFLHYLTEIHSGFRAYSRKYLETVRFEENSNDFVFDTEIIAQGINCGLVFREVPIVTRYFPEASSINFGRSILYGFGILWVLVKYLFHHNGLIRNKKLMPKYRSKYN
jgi:glycosyltransferase involved in cell wall biosynthesis